MFLPFKVAHIFADSGGKFSEDEDDVVFVNSPDLMDRIVKEFNPDAPKAFVEQFDSVEVDEYSDLVS